MNGLSSSSQPSFGKQGVIWGAALWLTHLSMLTPLMSLTLWISGVPAVMLYLKTPRLVFAGIAAASLAVGAAIAGPLAIGYLWIALSMLAPAIVIAESYRRKLTVRKTLTNGVLAYLAVFLLSLLLATALGGNVNEAIASMIREGMAYLPPTMQDALTDETIQAYIQLTVTMIPFYFIASAVLLTALTHTLSRRIARRLGETLPSLPPIRDWKLPKALVWYYLIALFIDLITPTNDGSFFSTIIVNLVSLFMLAFAVQGLSFLFFVGYVKRKAWIPWVGIVAVIFIMPLFSAFSLLGVFDTAFPLRDRLRKS